MRIVLLGPPGAGKGTQAVTLAKALKLAHIATGDIMRAAVAGGTTLGLKAKGYMDKGELVPDALVIDLIKERLSQTDAKSGFVLDGFPRTVEQAKALKVLLTSLNLQLDRVLDLRVPEKELIDRIVKRGQAGSGRSDDNLEVINKRLQVYHAQTAPVVQFYEQQGGLTPIDGTGSPDDVQGRLLKALGH